MFSGAKRSRASLRWFSAGQRLRPQAVLLACVVLVTTSLYGGAATACAACACGDPTLTVMGVGKPVVGRFRLSLEERFTSETALTPSATPADLVSFRKDPAVLTARIRGQTVLAGALVVHPRLTLSAEAAWAIQRTVSSAEKTLWTAGLSDVTLGARWTLWTDRAFVPQHLVAVTGGIRVPSPFAVDGPHGEPVSVDDQPSLGAHRLDAGLLYSFFPSGVLRPLSAFVSARGFVATPGFEGTLAGPGLAVTATAQFQPIRSAGGLGAAIQVGLDTRSTLATIDARTLSSSKNDIFNLSPAETLTPAGHVAMLHAGVVFSPFEDVLLRLLVRVPLVDTRAPLVQEGAHLVMGATWDL